MVSKKTAISDFREASISEFFEKNRHILGFDSPQKSLYIIVKEAMDNSLDACEEYQILPDIQVSVERHTDDEFIITVEDNGPGIDRKQVPAVFGKLLYGSRFHSFKQSRGQQGIGITAAILYGQITTARPSYVRTKRLDDDVAYEFELGINVKENRADIHYERPVIWNVKSGTLVKIPAKGKYQTGKQSIMEYIMESAVANPNANFKFTDPEGKTIEIRRAIEVPSKPGIAIKPHPLGLELGDISSMSRSTQAESLLDFLRNDFNRISDRIALEIAEKSGIPADSDPRTLTLQQIKELKRAFGEVKLMPPPTDCLSPLGHDFIIKGLKNVYGDSRPSHYSKPVVRPIAVHNGQPFAVEAGLVYGGDLKSDDPVRVVRFANKVPLLYQAGACAITRAIQEMDWRPYGLDQKSGQGMPYGPAIIFVHVYGIRIPFTSESKEAIASVDAISAEITMALKSLGRSVKSFLGKREKRKKVYEKFRLVNQLIPEIGKKSAAILGKEMPDLHPVISKIANVVFITEEIQRNEGSTKSVVHAVNFTRAPVSLKLYAEPPLGNYDGPELSWEISDLQPSMEATFQFSLVNVNAEYPGTTFYFTGIDPVRVQGAEPLPADYGIGGLTVIEEDEGAGEDE